MWPRAWLSITLLGLLSACEPAVGPARVASGPARATPAWLAPYSAAQRALLDSSPHEPVTVVAEPVYPALRAFSFLPAHAYSPRRARRAAHLIARVADRSQRLYLLADANATDADPETLYGPAPPPDADPWVRAVRDGDDGYRLEWAAPSDDARDAIARARRALADGDANAATHALENAVAIDPDLPGAWALLAGTYAARHDARRAGPAARRALALDPRSPAAERALALSRLEQGDRRGARTAIAHALAMYPASTESWALAARIVRIVERPAPPAVFVEVGTSGAVVVASSPEPGADVYALCHATFRHEPGLRSRFGLAGDGAYDLSQVEEEVCLEAMLGASPAGYSALGSLAREGELSAYALFDVLGPHRPEWLRIAPDRVHEMLVRYVERHVLAELER